MPGFCRAFVYFELATEVPKSQAKHERNLTVNHKSTGVAYLLLLTLGVFGAHQFYIGKAGRGISYLLTFGWLGFGVLVDLFTLPAQVRNTNILRGAEWMLASTSA